MKFAIQQMLATPTFSWSKVSHELALALLELGHEVHLKSTNGYQNFPEILKPYINENLVRGNYDSCLSYTALHNFPHYLQYSNQNRFGIHNYEFEHVPPEWIKFHKYIDKLLPSSKFSSDIYVGSKFPKEKVHTIPHGVNLDLFKNVEPYKLKTKKQYKILSNIAQIHVRKGIPKIFESFGKAFKKQDDVCLVMKVSLEKREEQKNAAFNLDFWEMYKDFESRFPNHAEIEIITEYIENIASLYLACDMLFSMTHVEGFHLPSLENLAAGKLVIVPNHGGQLEFLNEKNALLVSGQLMRCPKTWRYWHADSRSSVFDPSVDDAVRLLHLAIENYENLMNEFRPEIEKTVNQFTWKNAAKQILELINNGSIDN